MRLAGGSVHGLDPQDAVLLIVTCKNHCVSFLHSVEECSATFQTWQERKAGFENGNRRLKTLRLMTSSPWPPPALMHWVHFESQCSLCTRIAWLDACFYPCPDSVPIFPSPRHWYKPGSKVLTTNLLHLLSSPLRDIYPQHDEGKASNSLRLPRKDESPSPLVQLRSTPSHLFIVKSCIANDQPKHKHIYNDADHSSAASREKHPSRGLLGITSTHSRGWWCRTWLRVGVVHSVSVELQQLLRFSFFLPVAAHSKCILTNLKKITKLRWHRVIMTRNPNCAFIHWRGIGVSGDHCS